MKQVLAVIFILFIEHAFSGGGGHQYFVDVNSKYVPGYPRGSSKYPFKTITEALSYCSNIKGEKRATIYVRPGTYREKNLVLPNKVDLM